MYTHILIPTDGSQLSEAAAESAVRLAKTLGARVTVLHVVPRLGDAPLDSWAQGDTRSRSRLRTLFRHQAQGYLAAIETMAKQAGVQCTALTATGRLPYVAILEAAARRKCDLIYMAAHGRKGASGLVLGSETVKVLTHGALPVLVHRADGASAASARRARASMPARRRIQRAKGTPAPRAAMR